MGASSLVVGPTTKYSARTQSRDYKPFRYVASARRTPPIVTIQKLLVVTNPRDTNCSATTPKTIRTTETHQVTCFGAFSCILCLPLFCYGNEIVLIFDVGPGKIFCKSNLRNNNHMHFEGDLQSALLKKTPKIYSRSLYLHPFLYPFYSI